MYDPNDVALFFATFIPLCLYLLFAWQGRAMKVLSVLAACLAAAGLLMSRSRGGVIALAVVIVVLFLSSVPRIRGVAKVATVVMLAFVFINYFSVVEGRFQDMEQD
jgi:O-antigen ligase